jgi:hypothetical protein
MRYSRLLADAPPPVCCSRPSELSKNIQALLLIFRSPHLRGWLKSSPVARVIFSVGRTLRTLIAPASPVFLPSTSARENPTAERTSADSCPALVPFMESKKIKKVRYILINITLTAARRGRSLSQGERSCQRDAIWWKYVWVGLAVLLLSHSPCAGHGSYPKNT